MGVEREKEALWPRELSSAHRAGGGGPAALSQSRRKVVALRPEFTVLLQLPSAAMVKSWLQDGRGFWKKILLLLFSKYQLTKVNDHVL